MKPLWRKRYLGHLWSICLCSWVHYDLLSWQKQKTLYAGVVKNLCFRVVRTSQFVSWKTGNRAVSKLHPQGGETISKSNERLASYSQDWYFIMKYKWLLLWKVPILISFITPLWFYFLHCKHGFNGNSSFLGTQIQLITSIQTLLLQNLTPLEFEENLFLNHE